jgi:flotillin
MKNPDLLHTASEQFLGKKEHEIKSTVLQTLEGHLRAILGRCDRRNCGRPLI